MLIRSLPNCGSFDCGCRCGMEALDRGREAAFHRRGQEVKGDAHEGTPRLQIQATKKAQDPPQGGLPLQHPLSQCTYGRPKSK